jgi:HK97 family phage portal protein
LSQFLNKEQRDQARKIYSDITAGAENATNSWVLEGGAKYEAIDIPPDDLQMLESRQFQLAEIARFFRVPSHLINDSEKSTTWGSGLEQLNLAFLQYTLNPYLRQWESVISDSLLTAPDKRRVIVEHNVEGLLRADSAGRAQFYSTMAQNGLMTRNEIRRKENLPPKTGGDELTVQVNLAPVGSLPSATGGASNAPQV